MARDPRVTRGRTGGDHTLPDIDTSLAAADAEMGQGSAATIRNLMEKVDAMQARWDAQDAHAQAPVPGPEDRSYDPRGDRNRDRDRFLTKGVGEPGNFTLSFEHGEMFDTTRSPAEHAKTICSHFPTAPYLYYLISCSSYPEFKHGGPSTEVRQGLRTLNDEMLAMIAARAAAHPGEAVPCAFLDIFNGTRVPCIEAHSSMLDHGEPGAAYSAKYASFTAAFPINTARFWKQGAFTSCADNVLSITSQAEWNRLDLGMAGVSHNY